MNQDVPGTTVAQDLFEGLLRTDPAGNMVPGVAERWESSADGLDLEILSAQQRPVVQRDQVTAKDFVYGWRRVVDPATLADGAAACAHRRRESNHGRWHPRNPSP